MIHFHVSHDEYGHFGRHDTVEEAAEALEFLIDSGQFKRGELTIVECHVPIYHGWCE